MLEPDQSLRPLRSRRSTRKSASNSPEPAPIRLLEGRNALSKTNVQTNGRVMGRRSALEAPASRLLDHRSKSTYRTDPASRQKNTRLSLQSILVKGAASQERSPQRGGEALSKATPAKRRSRVRASEGMVSARSSPVRPSAPQKSSGIPSTLPLNKRLSRTPDSKVVGLHSAHTVTPLQAISSSSVSSPVSTPSPRRTQRRPRRTPSPLLHVTRLLILGVGVAAIAGTVLSVWNPSTRDAASPTQTPLQQSAKPNPLAFLGSRDLMPGGVTPLPVVLKVSQELTPLATTIRGLTAQYPGLTLGMFLIDLDNGHYIDLNSGSTFAAASMIKVPILVAFLQDVDAGKIRLDEMLTMQQGDVASESGDMQYQPVGTQYTALETAFKMITISDNTATNMLIARLGGAEQLNQRFRAWGLTNTMIRNPLPDVKGTNTTTPKELSGLLAMVTQGDLLSLRSRDRLLDIMRSTVTNSLLPAGLPPEVIIAHKTGNINAVIGDTGMVDMPSGKRYIISVIVQRSTDDGRAQELIRQISHEVYQSLSQPPANNGSASASPVSTNGQSSPSVTSPAAQSESPTVSVPSGNLSPLPASVSPVPTTPR